MVSYCKRFAVTTKTHPSGKSVDHASFAIDPLNLLLKLFAPAQRNATHLGAYFKVEELSIESLSKRVRTGD
jgi:hypothetical protein